MSFLDLPPAPVNLDAYTPIDLGAYDPTLAGWLIVLDPYLPLEVNERAMIVADATTSAQDRMQAMREWIGGAVIAWNFQRIVIKDGKPVAEPLPQPQDGGVAKCSQRVLMAVGKAIGEAIQPPKP